MRPMRTLRWSLLVGLAISAAISTNAFAGLPEWGRCVKGGKHSRYTDAACTGEPVSGGEYEWQKGTTNIAHKGFTSLGGAAELRTTSGIATDCTSESAEGRLTGSKGVEGVVVTFQGCHANLLGLVCTGGEIEGGEEGYLKEKPGEVKTRELKGTLGYIEGKGTAHRVVGISLAPEQKRGLFAQFICGGVIVVRVGAAPRKGGGDSIISPITPVNQMGITAVQTYTQEQVCEEGECHGNGVQIPSGFEGGKTDVLETELSTNFGEVEWARSAQTLTTTNTLEEEVEIKA